MARRSSPAPNPKPTAGLLVECAAADGRPGDTIEVYVGDDLLGSGSLEPAGAAMLSAHVGLRDVPLLGFPARLRVMNTRSGAEIGEPTMWADSAALLAAAGAPALTASFAGFHGTGPAFRVIVDRLGAYPRLFALHLDGHPGATASSVPDPSDGAQLVVFALGGPIAPGTPFRVVETVFGIDALIGTFDTALMLAASAAQVAGLQDEVAALRADNAALRRRMDTAVSLGRETLLLERLDLFYLLLSERIDRAARADVPAEAVAALPETRWFGPAEVDGIGIFDVETDGHSEWRWFGPDATIALRDLPGAARRVVLMFHRFAGDGEPPVVRVSTGGPAEPARLRSLEGRFALEIPVARATAVVGGMLILHLSFDRHQTSDADPRLLSAVFSGAEVILAGS